MRNYLDTHNHGATEKPTMPRLCLNCGREAAKNKRRCHACHTYQFKRKVERPRHLWDRKTPIDYKNGPRRCEVCGNPELRHSRKCTACYVYWQKTRKRRPRHLWDEDMPCRCCGIPLSSIRPSKKGRRYSYKGYCSACYQYRRLHDGALRPRELWGIGEYGWCRCGSPATMKRDGIATCGKCKAQARGVIP